MDEPPELAGHMGVKDTLCMGSPCKARTEGVRGNQGSGQRHTRSTQHRDTLGSPSTETHSVHPGQRHTRSAQHRDTLDPPSTETHSVRLAQRHTRSTQHSDINSGVQGISNAPSSTARSTGNGVPQRKSNAAPHLPKLHSPQHRSNFPHCSTVEQAEEVGRE